MIVILSLNGAIMAAHRLYLQGTSEVIRAARIGRNPVMYQLLLPGEAGYRKAKIEIQHVNGVSAMEKIR